MKKILLILFLISPLRLFAPSSNTIFLPRFERISGYEALIKAVVMVESSGNHNALNRLEMAYGAFQIREIRLKDFNNRTGKGYTLEEMYDYNKAKEVFLHYAKGSFEAVARSWNGSGCMTDDYWDKIKLWL